MLLDPPRVLPVGHLSLSSLNLYLKCVVRWHRRYILGEFEPARPAMVLGRAVGGAERDHYGQVIERGYGLTEREVLDAYADAWDLALTGPEAEVIDWEDQKPGRVKDKGARVLPVYHRIVAPTIKPIATERKFVVYPPDVDWTFEGYFDVEQADDIPDLKARSRTKGVVSAAEARDDLQPTSYLFARRAEGNPASQFTFHSMVMPGRDGLVAPRDVLVTPTARTDEQLDRFLDLLYRVAAEIAWRMEYDVWTPPPPGAWWCAPDWCGFWSTCPFGGKSAAPVLRPRPAFKPRASHVRSAIAATRVKAGTTTAAKVAAHLGVTPRSAASMLSAEARAGRVLSIAPTRASGRGAARVVTEISGPRLYALPEPTPPPEA